MTEHDPATEHVITYDPEAWNRATVSAALQHWGPDFYEHDPTDLMLVVEAALSELAPAIVQQERKRAAAEKGNG